jgi:tyrosine-protein phosphatase YwqE
MPDFETDYCRAQLETNMQKHCKELTPWPEMDAKTRLLLVEFLAKMPLANDDSAFYQMTQLILNGHDPIEVLLEAIKYYSEDHKRLVDELVKFECRARYDL